MGDGGTIPNPGQNHSNHSNTTVNTDVKSIFQIAAVTRPPMLVGKICDEGHTVTFSDVMVVVHNEEGDSLCISTGPIGSRCQVKLRSPAGFDQLEFAVGNQRDFP